MANRNSLRIVAAICLICCAYPTTAQSIINPYWFNQQPLLLDQFLAIESAPIATPRTAQPGPGSWTVTQNDGSFSITNITYSGEASAVGNQLVFPGQATPVLGDLRLLGSAITTNAGLACVSKWRMTGGDEIYGGFERATVTSRLDEASCWFSFLTIKGYFAGQPISAWGDYRLNNDFEWATVLRPVGAYLLIRGGSSGSSYNAPNSIYGDWTLLWVNSAQHGATVSPGFDDMSGIGYVDSFKVANLGGAWNDPYYLASARKATTVNDDTSTMLPDAIVEHTITAATGVTQELRFREVDANNRYVVRMDQGGSTIKLISVLGGSETELKTASQTWNNGTAYRISAIAYRSVLAVYVSNTIAFTRYSTATNLINATNVSVSHAGSNLISWNMHPTAQMANASKPTRSILTVGDSKTEGQSDNAAPSGADLGYQRYLVDGLNTNKCVEFINLRIGRGGYTVGGLAAQIDNDLVNCTGTPEFALLNIGANNAENPLDANYLVDYAHIVDSFRTKWPNIKVYCMRVWVRDYTNLSLQANAVASVCSTRSDWCFLGPDERVFLEGGDNGVTYTADGKHPNHAGYLLTAQQWRSVLGL